MRATVDSVDGAPVGAGVAPGSWVACVGEGEAWGEAGVPAALADPEDPTTARAVTVSAPAAPGTILVPTADAPVAEDTPPSLTVPPPEGVPGWVAAVSWGGAPGRILP